jgi:hypothetical protein
MLPEPVRVGTGYDDMLQRFLQDRLTWSDLISSTMPPRNPNNYNGDDEDEEDDEDEDREPAVIREPDEDE